ncbi:hypothetical protein HHI36_007844 [Cryptolaemus montrouzieri]|uniref:Reverse transcriptase domain-containing protein n=1 Tax=Cryptolaemus montrouzieri TaxID=559131 RepID=A0ABD2MQY4_9CUCU
MNGELINNIRYADDTVILASDVNELQQLVERVRVVSEQYGLKLNVEKSKWMRVSKRPHQWEQLIIGKKSVEQVNKYSYLGSFVSSDWDQSMGIKTRIKKARTAFNNMKPLFTSRDLSINLKYRLAKCYIFSILLYGVEAWTMTERLMKKLEAFELWVYRRILRIPWTDHITNEEVLRRLDKHREILFTVKKRKMEYFGHIMRHEKYRLLQLIIQGKTDSKRGPGRRRHSWLHSLRQWYGLTTIQLFRSAANKIRIAMLIANVRTG